MCMTNNVLHVCTESLELNIIMFSATQEKENNACPDAALKQVKVKRLNYYSARQHFMT